MKVVSVCRKIYISFYLFFNYLSMERYLSISEACKILGIHRVTLIKWIRQGKIRAYMLGNRWRIPYSEIERLLKGFPVYQRVIIY